MEDFSNRLPKRPTEEQLIDIRIQAEQFGGVRHHGFFKREIVEYTENENGEKFLGFDDTGMIDDTVKTTWAGVVHCPYCGERMLAKWGEGGTLKFILGEDGAIYDNDSGILGQEAESGFSDEVVYREGDTMSCRYCCTNFTLIRTSKLRHGTVSSVKINTFENIDGNLAIVTWIYQLRHAKDAEGESEDVYPIGAVVLDGKNHLQCYERFAGKYMKTRRYKEFCQGDYYCTFSDYNGHKRTVLKADCRNDVINQTTGEKTGLAEYLENGGLFAATYLRGWRTHRWLEALMKSRAGRFFASAYDAEMMWNAHAFCGFEFFVNEKEKKPCRMLGFSKEKYKRIEDFLLIRSEKEGTRFLNLMQKFGSKNFELIEEAAYEIGAVSTERILFFSKTKGYPSLERAVNYLKKQSLFNGRGAEELCDYWKSIMTLAAPELIFPRDLEAAHRQYCVEHKHKFDLTTELAFIEQSKHFEKLKYTNGEYVIFVCPNTDELQKESETLHHCIRTYAKQHISGSNLVFFVRHYRRPERSFYTTDYNINAKKPFRGQLHGYRNDSKRPVPQSIKDFLAEWEEKVLLPWARKRNADAEKLKLKEAV